MRQPVTLCLVWSFAACVISFAARGQDLGPRVAQAFGRQREAVEVQPDGLYICEAEEFRCEPADAGSGGWRARRFGENYYAATFANSFLSRKAFLAAPAQCSVARASTTVNVRAAGRYMVLVRYEAAYRFETQFRVQVEQAGKAVLDRRYGARDNLKIWAFSQKLQKEVGWSWGAVENVVWEGHDAFAELQPGPATIRLIADRQTEPAAKRHLDLVMLTTDVDQVKMRIEKERYLPLDGMLTQSGDVFLRVTNEGSKPLTFSGRAAAGGGNWQQHSPYWVHLRTWKSPSISVGPGETSEWVEVGGTMDSLADGQWLWTGNGRYKAEFRVRNATGKLEPLGTFSGEGDLTLAADADTRYSRRLRRQEQVLYDLLEYLRKQNPAAHGRAPQRTPIFGYTFNPLDQGQHAAAVREFGQLFSLTSTNLSASEKRSYIDVRGVATDKLAEYCRKLGSSAKNVAVVSLGDEIGLPAPKGSAAVAGFRNWLKHQGITLNSIAAGEPIGADLLGVDEATKLSNPALYYWSKRYQHDFGIQAIKQRTDILRQHLPQAQIGANYSPHYPQRHMFLGEVVKWVTTFRRSGMTLPWSEDYIWQVPVGTPQMNSINLDLFRAANRHHPDRDIMYYVMPHMPNNTPRQWRRLFYSALGHGMTMVNLFEFRPVHVAYTENHVDDPRMYAMILGSFRELSLFEDIVQDGRVRSAKTAMWFSETGDIWGDSEGSFAAAKRALYTAIRHQQVPLDFVVEQDALDGTLSGYEVLYLTDAHVSQIASKRLDAWVRAGGRLFATAGAGMFDELNRPNKVLRELLGVQAGLPETPDDSKIQWIKQDLPFAAAIDKVTGRLAGPNGSVGGRPESSFPVFGARGRFQPAADCKVWYRFSDGSPAVTSRPAGQGTATYCGFLPGLSYYHSAIPRRPVDRGATDDAMIHFLPVDFDRAAAALIASVSASVAKPVTCSQPLVESTVIESKQGVVIPLVNWTREPVRNLEVEVRLPILPQNVTLASGRNVQIAERGERRIYTFDLDVADALILR